MDAVTTTKPSASSAARFVGRGEAKVDAKGRVSVPADFRRVIGEGPLYACASLTDRVIECGGADLVDLMLATIAALDVYDEDRWAMEETVLEETQRLGFDENGRVILPKALREHAALGGQAGFAGRGQRFLIAEPAYLAERRAAGRDAATRHRETFRARSLPSVVAARKTGSEA